MNNLDTEEVERLKEDLADAQSEIERLESELAELYDKEGVSTAQQKPNGDDGDIAALIRKIDRLEREAACLRVERNQFHQDNTNLTEKLRCVGEEHQENYIRALSLLHMFAENEGSSDAICTILTSPIWRNSREWVRKITPVELKQRLKSSGRKK